ncbi:hypothetical protein VYU27_001743 [Nannochloropsis oceanica]
MDASVTAAAKAAPKPAAIPPTSAARVVRRKPYSVTRTKDIIIEASKCAPAKFQPLVAAAAWVIASIGLVFSLVAPVCKYFVAILSRFYKALEPWHPENLLEAVLGLFIAFFGGSFFLVVASAEAWRAATWEKNKKDLRVIYEDAVKVHDANKKDALVDADNNGVADIDEMDATKLFVHKLHIVFTSVNPEKLGSAVGNLNLAALAIIAALKVRFARIITLGRAMAEILSPVAKRILGPALAFCLPKDYQQWGAPSVGFLVQIAAIQVAWMLQRLLATVHSAMRGGMMFSRGGLAYLRKEGYIKKEDKDTYADEIVGATTAILGFAFQTSLRWRLPFPVNIILLPVTILETFLYYYVAA